MAFTKNDLLLSADKAAQLVKALSSLGQADPLQYCCDEAAATVARMTTGYVLDDTSIKQLVRALALEKAYGYANAPAPEGVKTDAKNALEELQAIAGGKRPNLPKVATASQGTIAGTWGSGRKVGGRIPGQ